MSPLRANSPPGTLPHLGLFVAAAMLVSAFVAATPHTLPLLVNTLLFAGGAAIVSAPIGVTLALLIHRTQLPGRRVLHGLVLLLIFLPPYLQLAGWEAGFGLQGWFCRWCFPDHPVAILAGWRGAITMQVLVNIPWITFFVSGALLLLPAHLEERALLDGPPLRVLRYVTLPQLTSAVLAATFWVFVLAAGDITITDVYQVRTFAEEIYTGFALGDRLAATPRRTLSGSLLILGLGGLALASCSVLQRQLQLVRTPRQWTLPVAGRASARWAKLAVVILFMGWAGLPLVSLLVQAGMQVTTVGDERVRQWSATKAVALVVSSPVHFAHEFAWSFALGQVVCVTTLPIALTLSWLSRRRHWLRVLSWLISLAGLAIPGPVVALALGQLVNQPHIDFLFYLYDRTLFVPWLALLIRLFPIAYLLTESVMLHLSTEQLEIASLSGAGRWQTLRYVVWPQVGPWIAWIWLIVLSLAVGDLSTTVLAVPPGVTTLAIRIFNLVHYGVADQLAGFCLATVIGFGGLAMLVRGLAPHHRAN